METCNSETNEFFRVKECVRIGVIRRLDGRRINDVCLETLHRDVRAIGEILLAGQDAKDIPASQQETLLDDVADEICATGIRGLSESLWQQPSDLPYCGTLLAAMIILESIIVGLFLPSGLAFYALGFALISFLNLILLWFFMSVMAQAY